MNLPRGKKVIIILIYLVSILGILSIAIYTEMGYLESVRYKLGFQGKDIECVILVKDYNKGNAGFQAGFSYEMLKQFAKDNHLGIRIHKPRSHKVNYLDSLKKSAIDILVMNRTDTSKVEGVLFCIPIEKNIVWAIRSDRKRERLKEANRWIAHYKTSEGYASVKDRYFSNYDISKRIDSGKHYQHLSPYDSLLQKYSAQLGWDWRLLAASVYLESGYSIDTRSRKGAIGVMQVMPRTASRYECIDLMDPEENIKAGIKHLITLQKKFKKYAPGNKIEQEKLTLAAYNAGEGRILDCIRYAGSLGRSHDTWKSLVEVIPDMRDDAILDVDTVRLGKFNGRETIKYVEVVFSTYHKFCQIHPSSVHSHSVSGIDSGYKKRSDKK